MNIVKKFERFYNLEEYLKQGVLKTLEGSPKFPYNVTFKSY